MSREGFIDKFVELTPSENYGLLRKQGIEHIEKLASKLWTDYNVHDPGITTLEMLSYAITDLGYRTRYPIEDILAEAPAEPPADIQNFFTSREILPCNPVSKNDFRAVMIDVPGVKNAWLEMLDVKAPQIYADCSRSELTLAPKFKVTQDALQRLEKRGIPQAVRQKLETILNQAFPDRKKFQTALEAVLGPELLKRYYWELFWQNAFAGGSRKIEPVLLQGLYDVVLELENDPELGDLNRYFFKVKIGDGDDAFSVDVILPTWELFRDQHIDPADFQKLKFGAPVYDVKQRVYEGPLVIDLTDGPSPARTYRVVSAAPKTEDNRQRIENALMDEESIRKGYQARLLLALATVNKVHERLHRHRNLGEDFCRYKAIAVDDIIVCTDLEVDADADIEDVLAEVFYELGRFLAPGIKFYTLSELTAKGRTVDEIFEGPALDHGFIDQAELAASAFFDTIRVSDLIQIIMDVPGVAAVKKMLLTNLRDGVAQTEGEAWCLNIAAGRAVRLDPRRCTITFFRGIIPYTANQDEVLQKLAQRRALERHNRLGKDHYDLPLPKGTARDIQRYYSIQNDYPLCYGIGPEGLLRAAADRRKAQAKQFKAFLLLYDQLLANYLAQLAHVKDLFSLKPAVQKTYFSQLLVQIPQISQSDVPGIAPLLREFVEMPAVAGDPAVDLDDPATYQNHWEAALEVFKNRHLSGINQREDLLENQTTYESRKNRLLDHLMARFNEKFTDYVLMMYTLDRKRAPSELIDDKLVFLKDYPVISRDRGKAFNTKQADGMWHSDNVSGLEKRVARLLGIESYRRRFLHQCLDAAFEIYPEKDEDGIDEYRFRFKDDDDNILLSSSEHFMTVAACDATKRRAAYFGAYRDFYRREITTDGKFYFNLVDDEEQIIARRIDYFDTVDAREQAIEAVVDFIAGYPPCEGYHLVEHILLRPKDYPALPADDDCLMGICVPADCNTCAGWVDPYSYRATVVIPAWPKRFQNMDFRQLVESTFRQEAPAHLHVKVCWVNPPEMQAFEEAYHAWLTENAKVQPEPLALTQAQKVLLAAMASLRSVYPETRLFECVEGEQNVPLLLNHSILGLTKE